ncbi:type III restriction endonuclease [Bacteroidia bacterium]|nr:type III restriction endonuclease [Bacteroidia bacterium]
MGAEAAYRKITAESDIASRLGRLRDNYVVWETIPHTPRVCLKVPTGGGKTIIAAHALKIVCETWLSREFPVVLWFTPSDTIRRQTVEALKNPRHPYREAIDEQFGGKVRVFDLDTEKFNIRPADIENNACVIVSTIQAFRQSNTDKYNVYKHNENLEPHFTHISASDGMEKDDNGALKFSFANLLHYHRPIVIVDEAHNAISGLSQEVQGRINPAAIVELTATPQEKNNTLYSVRASELKEEEMIKLPIALTEHYGWETAVDEAIAKRAELEMAASNERDYIRPILLFQAQDKNGEVNVEALKKYLIETANLPESEIAIATGEQKELDGIDIFARDCTIRYIITVEALKEGWDCSFAYILCSLANVKSNTAVEQLLGRVMRMPYAKTRKTVALNKAYAYVLSRSFGEAASALVDKLKLKGFEEEEAKSVIEVQTELFENEVFEINKVKLNSPVIAIPSTIVLDTKTSTIEFTKQTSDEDIQKICEQVTEPEAYEIKRKFACYKKREEEQSPAKAGERFAIPRLMAEIQGELEFADPEIIFENFDWDIATFASAKLEVGEFNIEPQGHGFVIDIDGNRLGYSAAGDNQMEIPYIDIENWQPVNLISWLDKTLKQTDIPQGQMVDWLRQAVEHLTEVRGLKLTELMIAKYVLAKKLEAKIADARLKAKTTAYQTCLFDKRTARVELDFNNGFDFNANIYANELYYSGNFRFTKHYLGANKVPAIDGGQNGEEFQCAVAIDGLPEVKYWLRNVARNPASFCLPTATDKFYPDFVAQLNDGRILIVEYKGAQFRGTLDVKEKEAIGKLWEEHTKGKGLFLMAWKNELGLNVAEQIKKKIQ